MREFSLYTRPFNDKERLYQNRMITINPGVTVLVGCNGSGKSTLLRQISGALRRDKISVFEYDNYREGGYSAREVAGHGDDMNLFATLLTSSEGEQIVLNMGTVAQRIGQFVKKHRGEKQIWVLLDALDSGLSIDNIDELIGLFDLIVSDNREQSEVYIVISSNAYELCRSTSTHCFDVTNGKYVKFLNYEEYRDFILASREYKDQRNT